MLILLLGAPFQVASQSLESSAPERDYYAYVAAESQDRVDLVRFGPDGGALVDSIPVGRFPTEIDGPHGLAMDPNGDRWYVSLAHGNPFGIDSTAGQAERMAPPPDRLHPAWLVAGL